MSVLSGIDQPADVRVAAIAMVSHSANGSKGAAPPFLSFGDSKVYKG
jgi:hypothetical protein